MESHLENISRSLLWERLHIDSFISVERESSVSSWMAIIWLAEGRRKICRVWRRYIWFGSDPINQQRNVCESVKTSLLGGPTACQAPSHDTPMNAKCAENFCMWMKTSYCNILKKKTIKVEKCQHITVILYKIYTNPQFTSFDTHTYTSVLLQHIWQKCENVFRCYTNISVLFK